MTKQPSSSTKSNSILTTILKEEHWFEKPKQCCNRMKMKHQKKIPTTVQKLK